MSLLAVSQRSTDIWVWPGESWIHWIVGCGDLIPSRSLRRILGDRWSDFVSNEWLPRETQMRFVTSIVRECQVWLYGHMAHFSDDDPAHQILSAMEPYEWRRPMRRPRASWLQQVDQHLKEMGMGQASAWGLA